MDYSALVSSIRNGDHRTSNRLCAEATPILKKYLISRTGCIPADADDAVQKMFEYVIQKIRDDEIENPSALLAYMLTTSKHMYYKILKKKRREESLDNQPDFSHTPNQLWELVDEEKQKILQNCLDKLRKEYREFITHWFMFPDAETEDVAEHFDISVNNVWIRKHRVIKKLNNCVNRHQ